MDEVMELNEDINEEQVDNPEVINLIDQLESNSEDSDSEDFDQHENVEGSIAPKKFWPSTVFENDDPLLACTFSPDSVMVAFAGQDGFARLVNSVTKEVIHTIEGHQTDVTCLGFFKKGKYLATGDVSGNIQVLNVTTCITIWRNTIDPELKWLAWHDHSSILLAGNTLGEIWMWLIVADDDSPPKCKLIHSSGVSTQVAIMSQDGKRLAVGYDNGMLRIFDLKSSTTFKSFSVSNNSAVTAMRLNPDGIMIAVGTADGKCVLVNSKIGQISTLFQSKSLTNQPIRAIDFCTFAEIKFMAVAQVSGNVVIFHVTRPTQRRLDIECELRTLICHPRLPVFYAACPDGTVKCFSVRDGFIKSIYGMHSDMITALKMTPDGKYIMSASEDRTVRIFLVQDTIETV